MSMADETKEWLLNWVLEPELCPVHQVEKMITGDEEKLWKVCPQCAACDLEEKNEKN